MPPNGVSFLSQMRQLKITRSRNYKQINKNNTRGKTITFLSGFHVNFIIYLLLDIVRVGADDSEHMHCVWLIVKPNRLVAHARTHEHTHTLTSIEDLFLGEECRHCVACGRFGVFVGFRFILLDSWDACGPQVERVSISRTHESHNDDESRRVTVIGGND